MILIVSVMSYKGAKTTDLSKLKVHVGLFIISLLHMLLVYIDKD